MYGILILFRKRSRLDSSADEVWIRVTLYTQRSSDFSRSSCWHCDCQRSRTSSVVDVAHFEMAGSMLSHYLLDVGVGGLVGCNCSLHIPLRPIIFIASTSQLKVAPSWISCHTCMVLFWLVFDELVFELCRIILPINLTYLNARIFQMIKNRWLSGVKFVLGDHVGDVGFIRRLLSTMILNIWHLKVCFSHGVFAVFHVAIVFVNISAGDFMCAHRLSRTLIMSRNIS